jgi:hypothetical protein
VRSLEEAIQSLSLELEQLKTSGLPASTLDLEVEPSERTKFHDAIGGLSAELARLTSDLADEASQKAQLLSLVQRQAMALAYAERHLAPPIAAKPGSSNGVELGFLIKSAVDQVFPRDDIANKVHLLVANAADPPAAKLAQVLELVKGALTAKSARLAEANDLLTIYVSNLLRFLDQLANSRDVQSWLIEGSVEDDFRPRLLAQLNRLTDFFARNGLSVDAAPRGEGFLGLPDLILSRIQERQLEPRDLLVAVQILAEVADVGRKFAASLQSRNDYLIADRLGLQREISRRSDDSTLEPDKEVAAAVAEVTESYKRRIESYKAKIAQERDVIADVRRKMQLAPPSEEVEAALKVLDDEAPPTEESQAYAELAAQLREITAARDSAITQTAELVERIERQTGEVKAAVADHEDLERRIADRDRQLAEVTAAHEKLTAACAKLQQCAEVRSEKIQHDQEEHRAELADLERRQKAKLQAQIAQLEEKLQAAERRSVEEISNIQERAKAKLRGIQKKLEAQTDKTAAAEQALDATREEFEQRLNSSTALEVSAREKIKGLEAQVRGLQAQVSDLRVDQKMAEQKLAASEDALKRERSIAESRIHTSQLSLESAHEQAIADQQAAFDGRLQALLDALAESLGEFVGDGINEESASRAVADVIEALGTARARVAELTHVESELAAVRSTLGIPNERPVIAGVAQLLAKASWEQWARRMHTVATDDFALARTNEEVQAALEEALMASQRQSGIARRLEILRFEKKLLVKGKIVPRGNGRKPTIRALIVVAAALKKIQKLAGQVPPP